MSLFPKNALPIAVFTIFSRTFASVKTYREYAKEKDFVH